MFFTAKDDYRYEKYRDDTVFQYIEKNYLTLSDEDRRYNNEVLKVVLETLIPLLRRNELFDKMFGGIIYSGSYYKGTKYGKPEEFDLDFILELPMDYSKIKIETNHKNYGFVKLKMDTTGPKDPDWSKHRYTLSSWLTWDNYLDQNKFRSWVEGVFASVLNSLDGYVLTYQQLNISIWWRKSGPAFTLLITTEKGVTIDVDLVPCLKFDDVRLRNGYRKITGIKRSILVVPKPLPYEYRGNIFWRPSFYEQEKEMLEGNLKPVIRMMKKFRDTQRLNYMKSYFIETIFYHEIENNKNDLDNYLRSSKTWLFMNALKKMKDALRKKNLPYYWHRRNNLIEEINDETLQNNAKYLERMINRIDNEIKSNKFILENYVLGERSDVITDLMNLPKVLSRILSSIVTFVCYSVLILLVLIKITDDK